MGWLLLTPALVLLLALTLYPVAYGAWLSLFAKHSFFPEQNWVGLGNYLAILNDSEFWASVWRGTVYSITTIVLQANQRGTLDGYRNVLVDFDA